MIPRLAPFVLIVALASPAFAQSTQGTPPPAEDGYAGASVPVALYCHIYDLLQPVPMNTQPMIDVDVARGFGSPTVTALAAGDGLNDMYFYSTAGFVEYNVSAEKPRIHPERGVSYDVLLDRGADVLARWYMSVRPLDVPQAGSPGGGGPEVGLMPQFTVRMEMRTGNAVGGAPEDGELIAAGEATLPPEAWLVQGPVEFLVNLGKPQLDIPGTEGFHVWVRWFNANTEATSVAQRDWVLHTGAKYPNGLVLPVLNPVAMYSVRPEPLGDSIAIHSILNSPLGNYDVDPASLELSVEGPTKRTGADLPLSIVHLTYAHNHHYEPMKATWLWNWRAEEAPPGEYKVTVKGWNLQRTAFAEKTASFTLSPDGAATYDDAGQLVNRTSFGDEGPSFVPLPTPAVLAGAIAAAAVILRPARGRRR